MLLTHRGASGQDWHLYGNCCCCCWYSLRSGAFYTSKQRACPLPPPKTTSDAWDLYCTLVLPILGSSFIRKVLFTPRRAPINSKMHTARISCVGKECGAIRRPQFNNVQHIHGKHPVWLIWGVVDPVLIVWLKRCFEEIAWGTRNWIPTSEQSLLYTGCFLCQAIAQLFLLRKCR